MPAIDRVKAHYATYLGDGRPLLEIPEWGEDLGNGQLRPLAVYWEPFTLGDHARCFAVEPGAAADERAFAKVVFNKAQDAAGNRLFSEPVDLHILENQADREVVRRLAQAITAAPAVSEMVEKLRDDGLRMTMHAVADRLGKTIEEIEGMSVKAFRETLAYHQVKKDAA